MTSQDRLKLAKAARELASEYAEGRGPELDLHTFCGCAAGELTKRADVTLQHGHQGTPHANAAYRIDADFGDGILTEATILQFGHAGYSFEFLDSGRVEGPLPGAIVFPLLAFADEMESAP